MRWIFHHHLKSLLRSFGFRQNVAGSIVLLFGLTIIGAEFIGMGFFLPHIWRDASVTEQITRFCMLTGAYLVIDIFLKLLFMQLPDVNFKPYLHLPVKKPLLAHFVCLRSLFVPLSIFPFLTIIPFVGKVFTLQYPLWIIGIWLAGYLFMILANNYLVVMVLRKAGSNLLSLSSIFAIVIGLFLLQNFGLISIWDILSGFCLSGLHQPVTVLVPLALLSILYRLNYQYVLKNRYPEEWAYVRKTKKNRVSVSNNSWIRNPAIRLEWQLLTRNPVFKNQGLVTIFIFGLLLFVSSKQFLPSKQNPSPDKQAYNFVPQTLEGECVVTINLTVDSLPETRQLAITGDEPVLGEWKTMIPMATKDSVNWKRSFIFKRGTEIAFKFTGGSWLQRAINETGTDVEPQVVTIYGDTTLYYSQHQWSSSNTKAGNLFFPVYMAVFLTGFLMLMYGQNLLAFSASYFDALLVNNIAIREIFKAKRTILQVLIILGFVPLIPYMVINHNHACLIFLSLGLYQLGINSQAILLLSPFQRTGIDLNQKMNFRRNSPIQLVQAIAGFALPLGIFWVFGFFFGYQTALMALALIGAAGLLTQGIWLTITCKIFEKNKYTLSDAFRK